MTAVVDLYSSDDLGFDLDVTRPLFKTEATRDEYFDGIVNRKHVSVSNFNKIGDDMLVGISLDVAAGYSVGRVKTDERWYYFRIRDIYVNETNRTRVVYDIDAELTFMPTYDNGVVRRCPAGNKFSVGEPIPARYYKVDNISTAHGSAGRCIVFALKQMKRTDSASANYETGPWFGYVRWKSGALIASNETPLEYLVNYYNYFKPGDIINAWVCPYTPNLKSTGTAEISLAGGLLYFGYYRSPDLFRHGVKVGQIAAHGANFGTDTEQGRICGFCDERGNMLYTFPDKTGSYSSVNVVLRVSLTTCEIDLFFNSSTDTDTDNARRKLENAAFTYACKPVDVVCDSWQEYAFRQRAADIESRKLQNEQALAGGASAALTGAATGAMLGSVVPGLGTVAGAVAGGIAGLATSAVGYGISSYYGDKEQKVQDALYKLAQDNVSVTGGNTAAIFQSGYFLYRFTLRADDATMTQISARNFAHGVSADGFTTAMSAEMKAAITADGWAFWAATVEVPVSLPASWKGSIKQTMEAGARWRRFGSW